MGMFVKNPSAGDSAADMDADNIEDEIVLVTMKFAV